MTNHDEALAAARKELDRLDEQMVLLINQRAELAQQIGQVKALKGLRVYAPDRERQILDRLAELNEGPVSVEALRAIYRELMSASLVLERSPRIGVLGPAGSYSHLAGRRKFGLSVEFELLPTITAVFETIERDRAEFGLVPVENSTMGGVGETLDALVDRDVLVCGEVHLAIHHHLLGAGPIESIERVYSKPEVFAQCRRYLDAAGLLSKTIEVASSAVAAQRAKDEPRAAAIASELAAEVFHLGRIDEFIEDEPGNVTRFLAIGKTRTGPTGGDKTSIVFGVGHKPGALVGILDVFRAAGINMTRIESKPNRGKKWEYHFFVDVEGHADEAPVATALNNADDHCNFWKILGAYPAAPDVV